MGDTRSIDSPLEAAAGTVGSRAVEAFSVLGNKTRLSILLALWEVFEPFKDEIAVPFSELRDRVGMRDSGQFNYHLDQLEGHFVEKTDDGYVLRNAGHQIVRTVLAGAGIEEHSFESADIDVDCDLCGAPTKITYEDEWLYIVCTECDGHWGGRNDLPSGVLAGGEFPPAGFTDRTPEQVWQANYIAINQAQESSVEGVCSACYGPMERSLDICNDHTDEGVCDNCGRRSEVMAQFRCRVCKNYHGAPPRTIVKHHPAVISFYYERGIPLQYGIEDIESSRRAGTRINEHEQELISEDPPKVRVTARYEGDILELTLDRDLAVIDVTESS